MAVAVARDVIERIRDPASPLRISDCGNYFRGDLGRAIDVGGDLKDYADLAQARCEVCMLGACMLSKARLFDDVPMGRMVCDLGATTLLVRRRHADSALSGVFSPGQLDLLECAFERNAWMGMVDDNDSCAAAAAFGARYRDPAERAIAIMENLIDHDGEFVAGPRGEGEAEP